MQKKAGSFAFNSTFHLVPFHFAGEEVRAEFFMEELNNGVKLCELIGVLQTKIAQSCPSALCKVSQKTAVEIGWIIIQRALFMLTRERFRGRSARSL